jgi:hypothetical protein
VDRKGKHIGELDRGSWSDAGRGAPAGLKAEYDV